MAPNKVYTAIGLMSGTSLDGIDAALVKTDGYETVEVLAGVSIPYDDELREKLRACLGRQQDGDGYISLAERDMTTAHAAAVDWLLGQAGLHPNEVDIIGFHGQTVFHDPDNRFTWQIGNGPMLARQTRINVINDFRTADVKAGGEGAPLLPLYHMARSVKTERPVAVLNIGGVSNVTWLGENPDEILAFDTGPGNALVNDWVKKHFGLEYDEDGRIAKRGKVDEALLESWLSHPYFARKPPKSLDRDAWKCEGVEKLSPEDGAATLTAFTVESIARALEHLPQTPHEWFVTGGGRHNQSLMQGLSKRINAPVEPVEKLGWNGDMLEAEGFAYLAVRSLLGLPLSRPETTGVPEPLTGGMLHKVA
jgi:anhydro-N-acetylmuramic acid kinase